VLTERGDTLVDFGIGRRLGERAGWPPERVELNEARFEAFKQTQTDGDLLASGLASANGCDGLRRSLQLAFAHARVGERAYAQAELARTGMTDAEMLRRYRARPAAPSGPASVMKP
jgi:hypothetical protein